jgi:hypothetical protein
MIPQESKEQNLLNQETHPRKRSRTLTQEGSIHRGTRPGESANRPALPPNNPSLPLFSKHYGGRASP